MKAPKKRCRLSLEYFREGMWEAVRRLSSSAHVLGEVLIEIIEIQEEEALP